MKVHKGIKKCPTPSYGYSHAPHEWRITTQGRGSQTWYTCKGGRTKILQSQRAT